MRRMCAYYYVGRSKKMKRSITIGFDARQAVRDDAEFGAYSRLVLEALALAAPRYTYLRSYVTSRPHHEGYEAIERLHNVETMEPDGALWRILTLPWRLWHISKDLHNGSVELYHGLTEQIPLGLARHKIRSVVTVHNMAYLYDKSILNSPENFLHRLYMGRMLHRVDRIVAVSESVKRDIIKHCNIYSDKVDVVYSGVAKRFTEPVSEETMEEVGTRYNLPARYILGVGAQIERRNMLKVIKILPLIDHEMHYVIVGRATAYTARLQRAAAELGVGDRVHFIHDAKEEDMPAIYHRATMLINISKYEGFASSLAEALTTGTPCIASRRLCMEEIAADAAIYINTNSRDELIGAIRRLTEDSKLRDRLTTEGLRHATRFRPEVVAFNLINCYRKVGIDIRG